MRIAFENRNEDGAGDAKATPGKQANTPARSEGSLLRNKEGDGRTAPTASPLPTGERVLEVACGLFAEAGFHGTHLREVCKRAKANVAGVCYHFHDKEGLYEAVIEEADRQLGALWKEAGNFQENSSPEDRLRALIQSLFNKLSGERAWIAKLLARELVDSASGTPGLAGSGLQRDFVLLQALVREFLGAETDPGAIRLHALSVVGECVFFCIAAGCSGRLAPEWACGFPAGTGLAHHVASRSIGALKHERI